MSKENEGGKKMNLKKFGYIVILAIVVIGFSYIVLFLPKFEKKSSKIDNRFGVNDVNARVSTHSQIKSGESNTQNSEVLNIVATNFASYDFIRAIGKEKVNVKFMLGAGKDSHSFEPTASDLVALG